ncbi:GMC oxidoreductase [Auricularia subglabra TFB-10046 SS5]|nr:GMC oxidoreductase [Auricularia subglabra TFB-10046 SS5]
MHRPIRELDRVGAPSSVWEPSTWPTYDVIVVGGGTSGCVVASRLSEDPDVSVLLLESGSSGRESFLSRVPMLHGLLFRTKADFNVATTYTAKGHECAHHWPRAKMLGGCSSMNALIYQYGSPSDLDEWTYGDMSGYTHWKWDNFKQYFHKCENLATSTVPPGVDPARYSTSGPVQVGFNSDPGPMSAPFIAACAAAGVQRDVDFNDGSGALGANRVLTYVDSKGERVSAETAYLNRHVLQRPNLKVAVGAHVTRVIFDRNGSAPRAVGVEFSSGPDSPLYVACARKEVVLSAGSVHTPQILMLSGIGPIDMLRSHSIDVVANMPGLGRNLTDHLVVQTRYRVRPEFSYQFLNMKPPTLGSTLRTLGAAARYLLFGTGPLTCNNATTAAFLRTDNEELFKSSDFPRPVADLTSGRKSPDVEIYSCPIAWKNQNMNIVAPGYLASFGTILLRPLSRGFVTLRSRSPFDPPTVDPGYLREQHDVDVLVAALRFSHRLTKTEPLESCLVSDEDTELDQRLDELNDAQMADLVHERAETLYHPTGSARMGPLDQGGVVDGYLRVHGILALRIADASIFPTIISGHPSAVCIGVGEMAADMIEASLRANHGR